MLLERLVADIPQRFLFLDDFNVFIERLLLTEIITLAAPEGLGFFSDEPGVCHSLSYSS